MLVTIKGSTYTLYDVCNDYSLCSKVDADKFQPADYKVVKDGDGFQYIAKNSGELHYFAGAAGLERTYVYGGCEE